MSAPLRRIRRLERFPFCISSGDGADDRGAAWLPVPAAKAPDGKIKAMNYPLKWWYRVRKWRFSHTLEYAPGFPFPAQTRDFYAHDDNTGGPPAQESDLERWPQPGVFGGDSTPGEWSWSLSMFDATNQNNPVLIDEETGVVRIGWNFEVFVTDANFIRANPAVESGDLILDPGAVQMFIDGIQVETLWRGVASAGWSGTITLTPIEYWTFPRLDGSEAIYNAETGEVEPGRTPHEARLR